MRVAYGDCHAFAPPHHHALDDGLSAVVLFRHDKELYHELRKEAQSAIVRVHARFVGESRNLSVNLGIAFPKNDIVDATRSRARSIDPEDYWAAEVGA
jgi:hypothetical protein